MSEWFNGARFGMFIHWGMYSELGRGEQVLFREQLPPSQYRRMASQFQAANFDPDSWAEVAERAGMRYAVLTSKHHDGYALFNSEASEFNACRVGPMRDLVGDFVEAFRRRGLHVGLYYSLADWSRPAYFEGPVRDPTGFEAFIDYTHTQVRELCSNYGKLDVLWFDADWPHSAKEWRSDQLQSMIYDLQPGIVINNRTGLLGDFDTPEQHITASKKGRSWEACMTSTDYWWGYARGDTRFKSPREIVTLLLKTASGNGNLLYNVGPMGDGTLPREYVDSVSAVGRWLDSHGEAIYETEGCNLVDVRSLGGYLTSRETTVYLHILFWPGTEANIAGIKSNLKAAQLLSTRDSVQFRQDGDRVTLFNLPEAAPDPLCTVVELEFEDKPKVYEWVKCRLWGKEDPVVYADWARR